jgi:threonine/homoserine/homoserine lactone efflux protein
MTTHEWLILAAACFIGASSPGPSVVLLMRSVIRGGRLMGLVFAITHGGGILLYAGMVSIGLAAIILINPKIMILLQIAGIGLLINIGINMIKHGRKPSVEAAVSPTLDDHTPSIKELLAHGRDGFMIVFLNPKVAAFFLAIFSQFLTPGLDLATRFGMTAVAWGIDTAWYALLAIILTIPAVMIRLQQYSRQIETTLGTLLLLASLGIAVKFLISL